MIQVQDYIEDEEEGVSRAPSSSKEADTLRVGAAVKEDNGPLLSARELNGIGGGAAATTSKKPSFKNSVFERLTATRNKVGQSKYRAEHRIRLRFIAGPLFIDWADFAKDRRENPEKRAADRDKEMATEREKENKIRSESGLTTPRHDVFSRLQNRDKYTGIHKANAPSAKKPLLDSFQVAEPPLSARGPSRDPPLSARGSRSDRDAPLSARGPVSRPLHMGNSPSK